MNIELFVARRYLKARHRTFFSFSTLISVGGVFVGVSALLITLSIMNGFQNELRRRILGGAPHIVIRKYFGEAIEDYQPLMDRIAGFKFVRARAPFILTKSLIRHKQHVDGVIVRGVNADLEKKIIDVGRSMVDGVFDLNRGCVIGVELAHGLDASVGDSIIISSPFGDQLGLLPRARKLALKGVFDLGMYDYNATIIYMNLTDVQALFELGNTVSGIELRVDDVYRTPDYARVLEKELGYPYRAVDWIESNRSVFVALKLEKIITFIVLTLIILVAGFNIIGMLVSIVKKKTKEIGILTSFGFSPRQIMRIFIYQGTIMGITGTLGGIAFSLIACLLLNRYQFNLPGDVYFIQKLPVEMSLADFIAVAVASCLVTFAATIYPALKAANLITVQALRNE